MARYGGLSPPEERRSELPVKDALVTTILDACRRMSSLSDTAFREEMKKFPHAPSPDQIRQVYNSLVRNYLHWVEGDISQNPVNLWESCSQIVNRLITNSYSLGFRNFQLESFQLSPSCINLPSDLIESIHAFAGVLNIKVIGDAGYRLGSGSTHIAITVRNAGNLFGTEAEDSTFNAKTIGAGGGRLAKRCTYDIECAGAGLGRGAQQCYFRVLDTFDPPIGDAGNFAKNGFGSLDYFTNSCTFAFYKQEMFKLARRFIVTDAGNTVQLLEKVTNKILDEVLL